MGRKGSEYQVAPELTGYLAEGRIPVHTHADRAPFEDELELQLRDTVDRVGATPEAGAAVARRVARLFEADDLRGLLLEFAYAWNLNGLGAVSFESDAGCDLRVARCWSCYGPGPGCEFVSRFLQTLLEEKMGFAYDVREVDCADSPGEACRFTIRVAEVPDAF